MDLVYLKDNFTPSEEFIDTVSRAFEESGFQRVSSLDGRRDGHTSVHVYESGEGGAVLYYGANGSMKAVELVNRMGSVVTNRTDYRGAICFSHVDMDTRGRIEELLNEWIVYPAE